VCEVVEDKVNKARIADVEGKKKRKERKS